MIMGLKRDSNKMMMAKKLNKKLAEIMLRILNMLNRLMKLEMKMIAANIISLLLIECFLDESFLIFLN